MAPVAVRPPAVRPVTAVQGVSVVKVVVAAAEVCPPPQLVTMLTVYCVPGVRPVSIVGEPVAACVWAVPPAAVYVTTYPVAPAAGAVNVSVALVVVRLPATRLVTATQGVSVVKVVLAAGEVWPAPQLVTTLTAYCVPGVRPARVTGEPVAVCVWAVPPAAVYVTV